MDHQYMPPAPMMQLVDVVRSANEECTNLLDTKPEVTSITEGVPMPNGTVARISCRRSKTGKITVTISPVSTQTAKVESDEAP
jgi:hypothetical protein